MRACMRMCSHLLAARIEQRKQDGVAGVVGPAGLPQPAPQRQEAAEAEQEDQQRHLRARRKRAACTNGFHLQGGSQCQTSSGWSCTDHDSGGH